MLSIEATNGPAPGSWAAIARDAVILLEAADTADARELARQAIYDLGTHLDELVAATNPTEPKPVTRMVCPKCGYDWPTKTEQPKLCPQCNKRLWATYKH